MYLESDVVPVCHYSVGPTGAEIEKLYGTAFFLDDDGVFVTARHVIENAYSAIAETNLKVGLVVKAESGADPTSIMTEIAAVEFAVKPFDIALGRVNYSCKPVFALYTKEVEAWKDVAAYGYPENAVTGHPGSLFMTTRCHKGYIQRLLAAVDKMPNPTPPAFELSFLLSRGISGAPLFLQRAGTPEVIGVCVGTFRSEIVEDTYTEILEDGKTYKETTLSVEQYGIAQDLRPLHDWKPKLLSGKSVIEVSNDWIKKAP